MTKPQNKSATPNDAKADKKTTRALENDMRNDPLFLEMKEEMARDNMINFFRKNGNSLFTLLVLLIVAIGAYKTWQHFHREAASEAGIKLFNALSQPEGENSAKLLQEAGEFSAYSGIAKINEAKLLLNEGKTADAVKAYDAVANDKGTEAPFRDLAALNAANILLNEKPTNPEIEGRLEKLTGDSNTYKYSARELLAVFHLQNNNNEKAKTLLDALVADPETPISISQRAKQILNTL